MTPKAPAPAATIAGTSHLAESDRLVEAARQALAAGDIAAAETLCQKAFAAAPGDARPWTMLSETALRRNRADAALGCAERALALDGRDPLAHVMRARCLAVLGRHRAGLAAASAGLTYASNAAAQDALGAVFGMLSEQAEARKLFRRAVAAAPKNPQFRYNLVAAERMLGLLDSAEANCDRLLADHPDFYAAYPLRADLRTQTEARNHVPVMDRILAAGVRVAADEVLLRFALAKECDDLGRYAQSSQHLTAASAFHRQALSARAGETPGQIIARMDRITQAPLPRAEGYAGDAPVFVVGLPRSGTTLVERTLAGHSAIASAGELGLWPMLLARASAAGTIDWAALGRDYCAAARERRIPPACRFIDKFPDNYLWCAAIHAALPTAKIIVVRRDPMDSCLALYRMHFAGTYPFSYDLGDLARHYAAFDRLIAHWRNVLPRSALIEIAYEDVVRHHERESRRLCEFLALAWEPQILRFHASATPCATASAVQIRQPLYSASIGKWRHYAAELEPLRRGLDVV